MRNKGLRMCVICRCHKEKSQLIRICNVNSNFKIDISSKIQARGFYICKDKSCIEKIQKNKNYSLELKSELLELDI